MPGTPQGSAPAPAFSVVVPIFQSTDSVVELVARTTRLFDEVLNESFEILLVDDGSDLAQTWPMLVRLAKADPRVRAIRLMRNFGKPAAVLCGFSHARGQWIVTIDDDLQQNPEDIADLAKFRDHDVVVATYHDKKTSRALRLTSWLKGQFDMYLLRLPFRMTPLKLIKRQIIDEILKMHSGRPYIPALLAHCTSDFHPVPLQHQVSKAGKSRYNLYRRMRQFSNLIIGNSGFFARIWAIIGIGFTLAGGALLAGLLVALVFGAGTIGLLLLAMLMLIGGMILMALGIVGEYLIRIVELTSLRAPFVVRQVVSDADETPDK